MQLCREAVPYLRQSNGRVINVTSSKVTVEGTTLKATGVSITLMNNLLPIDNARYVVTVDREDRVLRDHAVVVRDRKIAAVLPFADFGRHGEDDFLADGFADALTTELARLPGIGEKTAAKLVSAYDTLEGIYEHLDELPPKQRQNLGEARDRVFLNREMSRLRLDCVVDVEPSDLRMGAWDREQVRVLFDQLEFRSKAGS